MMRVLLLLLLCPLAAAAQTGKLAGRVVDDRGDPLPGANVHIEGTQLGTSADANGDYFIIGIPVGQYVVRASFVGLFSVTDTVDVTAGYTALTILSLSQSLNPAKLTRHTGKKIYLGSKNFGSRERTAPLKLTI